MVFSNRFLAKCSVYIAVGGMTAVMLMRSILIDKVRRQEYFQEAMKILRQNEGAKTILGEPIREVGLDIGEPNYANAEKVHFEVKVKGSLARGTLYFWAEKPKDAEKWNVSRMELELKDDDKRLVVKKSDFDSISKNETVEMR